jgi:RimJ/RimL family protein N-acetyltransferase
MKSFEGTLNYFWAIEENESGSHIGSLNAYLDTHNEIADLGLLVGASSAFGKGLGTEAWMAACDFLFRYRNVRKVTAGTLSVNIGMIRVCEKSGMQIDGRRSGQAILDGQEVDMVYYASFRRLWLDKYTKPLIAVIP